MPAVWGLNPQFPEPGVAAGVQARFLRHSQLPQLLSLPWRGCQRRPPKAPVPTQPLVSLPCSLTQPHHIPTSLPYPDLSSALSTPQSTASTPISARPGCPNIPGLASIRPNYAPSGTLDVQSLLLLQFLVSTKPLTLHLLPTKPSCQFPPLSRPLWPHPHWFLLLLAPTSLPRTCSDFVFPGCFISRPLSHLSSHCPSPGWGTGTREGPSTGRPTGGHKED